MSQIDLGDIDALARQCSEEVVQTIAGGLVADESKPTALESEAVAMGLCLVMAHLQRLVQNSIQTELGRKNVRPLIDYLLAKLEQSEKFTLDKLTEDDRITSVLNNPSNGPNGAKESR